MTIPVVLFSVLYYPEVRFVMITQPVASSLFIGAPENLVVIGVDVEEEVSRGLQECCDSRKTFAEYHIDAFVDLHSVIRTLLSVLLADCGVFR